jgi:hypothetical protein
MDSHAATGTQTDGRAAALWMMASVVRRWNIGSWHIRFVHPVHHLITCCCCVNQPLDQMDWAVPSATHMDWAVPSVTGSDDAQCTLVHLGDGWCHLDEWRRFVSLSRSVAATPLPPYTILDYPFCDDLTPWGGSRDIAHELPCWKQGCVPGARVSRIASPRWLVPP